MKVLWLSHLVPYPPAGGALQRSFNLLRRVARSHDVHLLALNQPRLLRTDAEASEARTELSKFCRSIEILPIPAERSRLGRLAAMARSVVGQEPYDVVWLRSEAMRRAVVEWRRDREVDLVHVDTVGLWPFVEDWDGTPIVLSHHNIESDFILRRAKHDGRAWRAVLLRRDAAKMRTLETRAASGAAVNVVVSELDRTRLRPLADPTPICVVENGVDTDYWQPTGDAAEGNGLVFAGTLGWYPNRDAVRFLLDEIWPLLIVDRPESRLTLVGRDPPPEAVAASVDARVTVTGFVPDARPFLDAASIYVCPIRVGGGTRLKILDALAMAKPLVATALAVEGLDLVAGQHYLPAETAEEFVGQIVRLDASPELRRGLGEAGRRFVVEHHDWQVVGQRLEAAYDLAAGVAQPGGDAA